MILTHALSCALDVGARDPAGTGICGPLGGISVGTQPNSSRSRPLALIPPPDDDSTKEFYLHHFSSLDLLGRIVRRPTPESEPKWVQKTFDGVSLEDLQSRCRKDWKVTVQAFWSVAFALAGQKIFNWGGHDEAVFGVCFFLGFMTND